MLSRHAQRGQTFPVWAMGSLSVMVLLAVVINYGNMLTWQFRAQNAADAATRALLSAQTTQWNQTMTVLHASAVDEYRIRHVLRDLDEVVNGEGGCLSSKYAAPTSPQSCAMMYANLRGQYLDALARYTADAKLLNRIATPSQSAQIANMKAALAQLQQSKNCGTSASLDCAFDYALVGTTTRDNDYLEDVYADCCTFVVGGGTSSNPKTDLTPMEIEVVACANVSNLIPSFFNFQAPTFSAIGRSAATSIMADQEFMYVGSVNNPTTSNVFQPAEFPETTTGSAAFSSTNDGYYRIDYGGNPDNPWNKGNPAKSDKISMFTYSPANSGLLVATGFWSAMPVPTFMNTLTPGVQFQCK